MGAVKARSADPADPLNRNLISAALVTAVSQTDVVAYKYTPGYAFQVTRVRSYCRVKAGTITYTVKVGTRTVVSAAVFTTATEVAATISSTLANLKGSKTEAISVEYTSDGAGALTNGFVLIEFRAFPMRGEVAQGDQ